jgi:hypothetical protein
MLKNVGMISIEPHHRYERDAECSENGSGQINSRQLQGIPYQSVSHKRAYPKRDINKSIKEAEIKVGDMKLLFDVEFVEGVAHAQGV